MKKSNKLRSLLFTLFIISLFLLNHRIVSAEVIQDHSTNMHMRYTEIIDINEKGDAKIWVIIRLKFFENNPENNYLLSFKIDSHVNENTIKMYPDRSNETFGRYLNYQVEEYNENAKIVWIELFSNVSEVYQYYSFIFHYTVPAPYLAEKISESLEEGERWIINHKIHIPKNLNDYIRLAIVLPKKTDVQDPDLFAQYTGVPKGIKSVLELDYEKWNNENNKEYFPLPFNDSIFENRFVLYNNEAPNDVHLFIKYELPNKVVLLLHPLLGVLGIVVGITAVILQIIKSKSKITKENFLETLGKCLVPLIIIIFSIFLLFNLLINILTSILGLLTLLLALIAIILTIETTSLVRKFREEQKGYNHKIMDYIASTKTSLTMKDLKEESIEKVDVESDVTEEERKFDASKVDTSVLKMNYRNLISALSKEIEEWGQYIPSVAIEKGAGAKVTDFILYTKDGPLPIEAKVYPKRIISNNLPYKIRDELMWMMELVNASTSLLIVLTPGITERAKAIIRETEGKIKIDIIHDENIENLIKKFRNYLNRLEPL